MVESTATRYCSPEESLKNSLKEMQLIRKGKKKGTSWDEFLKELDEDKDD